MTCYIQSWKNETWKNNKECNQGHVISHTAGDNLGKIKPNDIVYIVSIKDGVLCLQGKMQVDKNCSREEAEELIGKDLWEAKHHLIANRGTRADYDRTVGIEIVKKLRVVRSNGSIGHVSIKADKIDKQALRHLTELTGDSAMMLDNFVGEFEPV